MKWCTRSFSFSVVRVEAVSHSRYVLWTVQSHIFSNRFGFLFIFCFSYHSLVFFRSLDKLLIFVWLVARCCNVCTASFMYICVCFFTLILPFRSDKRQGVERKQVYSLVFLPVCRSLIEWTGFSFVLCVYVCFICARFCLCALQSHFIGSVISNRFENKFLFAVCVWWMLAYRPPTVIVASTVLFVHKDEEMKRRWKECTVWYELFAIW